MNAKMARPWQRQDFKHPNLIAWVIEHRGEILAKLLTLARGWVVAGKPLIDVPPLGNYAPWAQTVGSILAYGGIEGFLLNLQHLYATMDTDLTEWSAFVQAWHHVYGTEPRILSAVVADLRSDDVTYKGMREALPEDFVEDLHVRANKDPERLQRRLGNALKKLQDRYFEDGLHIVKAGQEHRAIKWRVIRGNSENPDKADYDDELRTQDSPDSPTYDKGLKSSREVSFSV